MEKKICSNCGLEKSIHHFHRHKLYKDGRNKKCALCVNEYNKKYKKETIGPDFRGTSKWDWCMMYRFMEAMGYDVDKDIHEQFITKHNLKYKKRPSKNTKLFLPGDCK